MTSVQRRAARRPRPGSFASACGRSRRTSGGLLQLRFSEVGGPGVREELERVRLERVREMLKNPRIPIGGIASACGFVSETNLRNRFHRLHGCTMREYRKRMLAATDARKP